MRISKDNYFMQLAMVASKRAGCAKRAVGCVLVDRGGYVLSVAYNGTPSGAPHCDVSNPCDNWQLPSGLDNCLGVHAEQNALLQCRDPREIATAYVTLSPCKPCVKLLMNTGCQRIVFLEEHVDPWPKEQWLKLGREWTSLPSC